MENLEAALPEVTLLPPTEAEHGAALLTKTREVLVEGHKYSVEIKDADSYAKGVRFAQQIDAEIKVMEAEREKICKPLHLAHRNATSFFNRLLEPRKEIKRAIENAVTRFRVEQERLERLENERLAAIEKKRRELNELHDAAIAEDMRLLQAFLKSWDDAVSYDADRTRAIEKKKEEDARLAHAAEAERVGNKDGVSAILGTPMPQAPAPVLLSNIAMQAAVAPAAMLGAPDLAPAVVAPPAPPPPPVTKVPPAGDPPAFVPSIKGVSQSVKYRFKIASKRKFLQAVLDDHFGMDTVTIEDGPGGIIGKKVRDLKGACVEEYAKYGIDVWAEADDKIRAV
jgi:hypothetical protein